MKKHRNLLQSVQKLICIFLSHKMLFLLLNNFENGFSLALDLNIFVVVSFTKGKTGSHFPVFCDAIFHHPLITRCCNPSGAQSLKHITISIHLILVEAT